MRRRGFRSDAAGRPYACCRGGAEIIREDYGAPTSVTRSGRLRRGARRWLQPSDPALASRGSHPTRRSRTCRTEDSDQKPNDHVVRCGH